MKLAAVVLAVLILAGCDNQLKTKGEKPEEIRTDASACIKRLGSKFTPDGGRADLVLMNGCGRELRSVSVEVKLYDGQGGRLWAVEHRDNNIGKGEKVTIRVNLPPPQAGVKAVSAGTITALK